MANALLTPISYAPARSKLAGFDSDSGNCFSPQFTLTFQASKKVAGGLLLSGINKFADSLPCRYICFSAVDGIESVNSSSTDSEQTKVVPMPIVHIIQDADSDATVVEVSFGDRLGALLDTMKSLKELGLDVAKGSVITENSVIQTKFYITLSSSGRKVEDPDLLEKIRLSIITNLLKYHPESSERLAMGETFGVKAPPEKLNIELATRVKVKDDGPSRSLLYVETADRPGLMLDLIKTITDINIDVESAEIDTEGLMAKDKFYVSYRGKALNASLSQVLTNCLRYYLKRPGTIEDSY